MLIGNLRLIFTLSIFLLPVFTVAQNQQENTVSRTDSALFTVKGMTCQGCVSSVEAKLSKIDGVKKYEVSLEKAEAVVEYDIEKVSTEKIEKEFVGSPYKVELKKPDKAEKEKSEN